MPRLLRARFRAPVPPVTKAEEVDFAAQVAGFDVGRVHGFLQCRRQLGDNIVGGALWRHDDIPFIHLGTGHTGFGQSGYVGQDVGALGAGYRQRAQFAALNVPECRGQVAKKYRYLPARSRPHCTTHR